MEISETELNKARQVIKFLKQCRIGDRVKVRGIYGIVSNRAGYQVQVKFPDAHMEWLDYADVEVVLLDSKLKSCPFCNSEKTLPVSKENYYNGEEVYSCSKCGNRFSVEKEIKQERHKKVHCQFCGKKSAKNVFSNLYKCESCSSTFTN